jgi:hypothetical protein
MGESHLSLKMGIIVREVFAHDGSLSFTIARTVKGQGRDGFERETISLCVDNLISDNVSPSVASLCRTVRH